MTPLAYSHPHRLGHPAGTVRNGPEWSALDRSAELFSWTGRSRGANMSCYSCAHARISLLTVAREVCMYIRSRHMQSRRLQSRRIRSRRTTVTTNDCRVVACKVRSRRCVVTLLLALFIYLRPWSPVALSPFQCQKKG